MRKPAVAGSFYPSDPDELSALIEESYRGPMGPGRTPPMPSGDSDIVAVVSPHAGYIYSGAVAAHSYLHASSLRDPDLLVVVGPNHYGVGSGVSTFPNGAWETPLGVLKVDAAAAEELAKQDGTVAFDTEAHRLEHSLEVQLPFLQKLYGDSVPLLPVSLIFQDYETSQALAKALARVVSGRRAVVVASSDLTHYEPVGQARQKDGALLQQVVKMDPRGFYSTLDSLQVTACGFGAISVVMQLAEALGLRRAEVLKYATSGDTTGDNAQVVGYAALRFV